MQLASYWLLTTWQQHMNWAIPPEEIEMGFGVGWRGKDKLILLVFHKKPQIFRSVTLHSEIQGKKALKFMDLSLYRGWSRALLDLGVDGFIPSWGSIWGALTPARGKILDNSGQIVPTFLSNYWWKHKEIRVLMVMC